MARDSWAGRDSDLVVADFMHIKAMVLNVNDAYEDALHIQFLIHIVYKLMNVCTSASVLGLTSSKIHHFEY